MRIERAVTVAADPGRVYEVVADIARRPEWLQELRRVDAPEGPIEVGTRFTGVSSLLFHQFVGESEVVRVEPDRVLAERIVVGTRLTSEWELTPTANGTTVRHCLVIELPGGPLSALERWVLRRRMASMQKASLAALAKLL